MTKADEYRRLGQQCIEMAGSVSNEEARTALIERAKHWHRLADEQQPVVQQQQQVPPTKE
jgi:hypothetical protein